MQILDRMIRTEAIKLATREVYKQLHDFNIDLPTIQRSEIRTAAERLVANDPDYLKRATENLARR